MEIQGKVRMLLPAMSGTSQSTGNPWMSQDFVIDYFWWPNQQQASQMVLKMFGADRIKQWDLHDNDEVKVRYHIEAHEYNGRWFNEVRCDGIEKIGASAATTASIAQQSPGAQQDAGQTPISQAQAPGTQQEGDNNDDLPF